MHLYGNTTWRIRLREVAEPTNRADQESPLRGLSWPLIRFVRRFESIDRYKEWKSSWLQQRARLAPGR